MPDLIHVLLDPRAYQVSTQVSTKTNAALVLCTIQPEIWVLCRERADKEAFYEGQGSTGGGFMRMALTTLALLNKLSAHPVIKQSFLQPPLVGSAAFNCLHFLELLVSLPNQSLELLAGLSNCSACSHSSTAFQCFFFPFLHSAFILPACYCGLHLGHHKVSMSCKQSVPVLCSCKACRASLCKIMLP